MKQRRHLLNATILSAALVMLLACTAGCVTESHRPALKSTEEQPKATPEPDQTLDTPRPPAHVSKGCEWQRLPVVEANVEDWKDKQLLVVKTKAPGPGWRVVLQPLSPTDPTAREFMVVGLPPEFPAEGSPEVVESAEIVIVLRLEVFGEDVDQVVVYGVEDALVIPPR